ncbi:MAG: protein kinase [Myxococcales bacterium]|nr:protein kinase [Myxococcales bacterium]
MAVVRLPQASLPLSGRRVELGELVGRGSRTSAHRAELVSDGGVRRRVIVKLFDTVPSDDAEGFVRALGQSVARAALVDHPNVAHVYEHGVLSGRAYVLAEHVSGVSLAELLAAHERASSRLAFDVALFVASEVADALAGALVACDLDGARARVLHGDLSARQVMLAYAGAVKVTDFEIGRVSSAQSGVRSMRTVSSRLEMLAPELVHGRPQDARSDVFALGMLVRSMFLGPRFPAEVTHAEALAMVRAGEVQQPVFRPRLPEALTELLLAATATSPDDRPPNARVVAWELRKIAFSHGVGDARPFLARAIERAFPGQSPYAIEDDEPTDDEPWPDEDVSDSDFPPSMDDDEQDARTGLVRAVTYPGDDAPFDPEATVDWRG